MSARFRSVVYGPDDMFGSRPVIGYLIEVGGAVSFVRELPEIGSMSTREYGYLIRTTEVLKGASRFDQLPIEVGPNFSVGREFAIPVPDPDAIGWLEARVAERHPPQPAPPAVDSGGFAVALFPWWQVSKREVLGDFELVPVLRTTLGFVPADGGAPWALPESLQTALDTILSTFRVHGKPIERLTLVLHAGDLAMRDPSVERLDHVADFGAMVVMSALAARRFFDQSSPTSYTNTHDLEFVIQRFKTPASVLTRRAVTRDGLHIGIGSAASAVSHLPSGASWHPYGRPIDAALLNALMAEASRSHADWPQIEEAVVLFAQWNRDDGISAHGQQLVLAVATYLALFGVDTKAIEPKLVQLIGEELGHTKQLGNIQPGLATDWVKDFCKSRGAAAHGYAHPSWTPKWSPMEHLLFAAYLFPLVLKRRLAAIGTLTLLPLDDLLLATFEARLAYPPDPPDAAGRRNLLRTSLVDWWPRLDGIINRTEKTPDARKRIAEVIDAQLADPGDDDPEPDIPFW